MGEGAAEGMGKNGSVREFGKGAVPRKRDDGVRPTTLWGATQRGAAHKRRRYDVKRPTSAPFFPPDRRCAFPYHSPQVQKHLILHSNTSPRPTSGAKTHQIAPGTPLFDPPQVQKHLILHSNTHPRPTPGAKTPQIAPGMEAEGVGEANDASRGQSARKVVTLKYLVFSEMLKSPPAK